MPQVKYLGPLEEAKPEKPRGGGGVRYLGPLEGESKHEGQKPASGRIRYLGPLEGEGLQPVVAHQPFETEQERLQGERGTSALGRPEVPEAARLTSTPVVAGNIDLSKRPVVKNEDGTISTVKSMSFNEDGLEVLIPTVSDEGRILTKQEAIDQYHKTGRHLGKFSTVKAANMAAEDIHRQQEALYGEKKEEPGIGRRAVNEAIRPFKAQGLEAAGALTQGVGSLLHGVGANAQYLAEKLGIEDVRPPDITEPLMEGLSPELKARIREYTPQPQTVTESTANLERAARYWIANGEALRKKAEEVGTNAVDKIVGEAVGGAVPGITEFMLNVPYAALTGAREAQERGDSEITGALTGAAKRYLLGKTLHATGALKRPYRVPLTGGIFAAQGAGQGQTPEEVAKGFGVGALYGLMGGPGKMGLREIREGLKRGIPTKVAPKPKAPETEAPSEAAPGARERRTNPAKRAQIDEMIKRGDTEGIYREIYEDHVTGLPNARAWKDMPKEGKTIVSADLEGLNYWNDTYGHDAGDALLETTGRVMKKSNAAVARKGGDEFAFIFDSPEQAQQVMPRLQERLANEEIPIGEGKSLKGARLHYGIGKDFAEADRALYAERERLTSAGQRGAKGQKPPGLEEVTQGQYNMPHLRYVKGRIAYGEAGGKVYSPETGQFERAYGSAFPEWFKNRGYTKAGATAALDKAIRGEKLTDKQTDMVNDLLRRSESEYKTQGRIEVDPTALKDGQRVIIDGEKYTKHTDTTTGDAVLEDGQRIRRDAFDKPLQVDEVLPPPEGVLKPEKVAASRPKPTQPDMLGVGKEGLEGKIPTEELPETELERGVREAKGRKVEAEERARQGEIPTFSETLYRGKGKTPTEIYGEEAVKEGRAVPLFGEGKYYAFSPEEARTYGKVSQEKVSLRNPFVLDSDVKWRKLLKDADAPHLDNMAELFYKEPEKIPAATEKVQSYLKSQGYDGLIVRLDKRGDSTRRLAAMAGHDQVVAFEKPAPESVGKLAEEGGALAFEPKGNFRRPLGKGGAQELVKRSEIVKDLSKMLDVPIRTGKFRQRALGIYKIKPEVARTKIANDIEVISHEVGHHLHKNIFGLTEKGTLKADPLKAFKGELDPIATKPRAGQSPTPEGFAEFIRLYITNEKEAKVKAPRFFEYFDGRLKKEYPEVREVLLKARKDFSRWVELPSTARILSHISINEKPEKGIKLSDIYTAAKDDLYPLHQAVKELVGKGELAASKDPYVLARLSRGWWSKVDTFFEYETFSFKDFKRTGKPLKDILRPVSNKLDDFRVYIVSKRALELRGRGKETGIRAEDAKAAIRELENAKFKTAFKELKTYQDNVLKYLRDSGVLSPEIYQKMKRMNEEYVPFYRVMEGDGLKGGANNRTFGNLFSPVKGIKGSGREIVDPLESVIKNTYSMLNIAERNGVGKALADLAEQTHGGGKLMERIPTPMKRVPVTNEELYAIFDRYADWKETTKFQELKKEFTKKSGISEEGTKSKPIEKVERIVTDSLKSRGMTEGEAKVYIEKLKTAKTPSEVNEVVENIIEKQTLIHTVRESRLDLPRVVDIFRPSRAIPKDENVMTVYRNGKPTYYSMSPELHQAMLALNRESSNILTRVLSKPARLLRAGATLTPEFAARNPMRDQFMAFVQSEYGYKPGVDLVRGLYHALRRDDLYWQFKKSGAEHSMLVSLDRDYLRQNLRDILSGESVFIPESIRPSVIKHPIELLRMVSEFGETATRLGEFRKALKAEGKGKEGLLKSGYAAREVTLDFARVGAKAQAMNMITAFWNARLEGIDKIGRTFREHPVRATAKSIVAITVPSILLYYANHDDPRYKELPRWQRDLFWIVMPDHISQAEWDKMTPEQRQESMGLTRVYRIPKPFELGILFGSFPERILEYEENRDPKVFKEWAKSFLTGASPGLIPTVAVPLVENFANWSLFTDRPIVPEYLKDVEPGYQASPYAPEILKRLGRALGYPPNKIENLIRGYTGGLGMLTVDAVDAIFRKSGLAGELPPRPKRTLADIPGLRAFVVRFPTASTESIQNFYNQYEKSRKALRTYRYLEEKESPRAERYYQEHKEDIERSGAMGKVAKGLGGYFKLMRGIYSDKKKTREQKRKALDEITLEMIDIAQEANKYFKPAPKPKPKPKPPKQSSYQPRTPGLRGALEREKKTASRRALEKAIG